MSLSLVICTGSRASDSPQTWHVAWAGSSSRGQHLDVPTALASSLGIAQGITVAVKALPDVPQAIGVCVEPLNSDDWEVVEQNADYMEEQILNQVRQPSGPQQSTKGASRHMFLLHLSGHGANACHQHLIKSFSCMLMSVLRSFCM